MPVKIKLGLSLVVVLVAAIAAYYQHVLGHERIQYVVAFLGFFMIFAMWLFPEVKREESAGGATARHNKVDRPRKAGAVQSKHQHQHRTIASGLRAVGRLVGAAIEYAHLFFGDSLVEGQRFRLKVALRHVFRLEVVVSVLAAHQRRPIPLAYGLLQPGRDIADRQTDASVIGTIGFRSME